MRVAPRARAEKNLRAIPRRGWRESGEKWCGGTPPGAEWRLDKFPGNDGQNDAQAQGA